MKYFVITGEKSGDLHAADLISALFRQDPEAEIVAYAGEESASKGATVLKDYSGYSVMGFFEILFKFPFLFKTFRQCKADILKFNPDKLILVDFSGFNLRIARFAKKKGFHVTYYIAPKTWAWNQKRNKSLKQNIDLLLGIFPFEQAYFRKKGINATYVGNPTVEQILNLPESQDNKNQIVVLPGSRKQEVVRTSFLLRKVAAQCPELSFTVSKVSQVHERHYSGIQRLSNVKFSTEEASLLLQNARAAIVTSGTATLEAALLGVPQVVIYKTNPLSFQIAKRILKIRYISLPNILLNRKLISELIQGACTPGNIIRELDELLNNDVTQKKISEGYSEISQLLGHKKASQEAAKLILSSS